MNGIIKNLETMYHLHLFSNVIRVCELSITMFEHSPEYTTMGPNKQLLYLYYADSLFNLGEYVHAESIYRKLVQMKKYLAKNKNANVKTSDVPSEAINDVEIKYKVYLCCMKQKQRQQAIEILQSIQGRHRTPKINMALATLYKETGNERAAITAYKEVLKEVPLALEAAENLLEMGVQGVEVSSLTLNAVTEVPWVGTWLKGQAELVGQDYNNAATTFKTLDTVNYLKDNSAVLVNMALCYNYLNNTTKAINCLQRAVQAEPHLKTGRDLLATLLANSTEKEHHIYLEKLLMPFVDMSLWSAEQFVVLGNYMYVNKKYEKALYFGHQACLLDGRNVEGALLKARAYMQNQKYQEAAMQCVEAQMYSPRRFDIYKCLVECYVHMNRLREAEATASNACKKLNQSAQALALHASLLMKDPINASKVKRLLEKAISADSTYTTAVVLLAEHLEQEQQYEEAVQLLMKHVAVKPTTAVHQLIGDNFARLQKEDDAFSHYCIALRLDPNNQKATEGLNNIGRSVAANKRDSYYVSTGESSSFASQGLSASDHDPDPESDTDQWPTIDF